MGTSPGSGSYQVALSALRADAAVWRQASETVDNAQASVAGETLTAAQFSYWADGEGVTSSYTEVQHKLAALLGGAATNFLDISTTLVDVARQYSANESKVAASFTRIKH